MKKILITGGTGFVGSGIIRYFLAKGYLVDLIVRESSSLWRVEEIRNQINLHVLDLADKNKLVTLINKINPNYIFHLAVHGAYSWQNDIDKIIETNINSGVNLLQAFLNSNCEKFIQAGSSSEYGFKDHAPKEDEYLNSNSTYSATKGFMSMFAKSLAKEHNRSITTLRLYSVYGPYEEPKRLMPNLVTKCLNQTLPPLVDPNISRDFIYIDDVAAAFESVILAEDIRKGEVYNVGSGTQTKIFDVVQTAKKVFDLKLEANWNSMQSRSWDTNIWVANIEKIKSELGWEPTTTLDQGLIKFKEWFLNNPNLYNYYISQQSNLST